ncbi:MAG: YihY/virulence factor BrkB family protein [Deltaproteobacteria bacterium]|nr:YihY/virulence factor BrkB family protein [Deltaproteobacteria bacterium]
MAAAIAFYAMLSLIPFIMLLLSCSGYLLEYLGQDYASREDLFEHIASYVRAVLPFAVEDFLERLRSITANRGAYGLTGLGVLVVTAGLVFRTLELAFSRIFKTRRRSLVSYQLVFMAFVLAVGLILLGVHYLGTIASSLFSAPSTPFTDLVTDYALVRFAMTIFFGTVVFAVLLKYFSRERVRTRAALLGGLLFALLWIVASKAFAYYLNHIARFSMLYGSLATLAVIVVWIFYSALILLLCTEFSCSLQNRFWPLDSGSTDDRSGPREE